MKKLVQICKFIVGVLFIFSGFVKADDPLGFSYKLQEYFEAFGWEKFITSINSNLHITISLWFASTLPVIEMAVGLMVLIGARKKLTLWILFLMTLFFTFLTFYTAYYHKVLECGCFGDAIPMTPWQSFGKNIALLIFIGIIAAGHKHYMPSFSGLIENAIVVVFLAGSVSFSWYCYNYLPVIDFRPYKVGTDIKKDMQGVPDVLKYYYTLKDKKTGQTKEFDTFPNDWQNYWDYVSNRTVTLKKGIDPKIKDFNIVSPAGNDCTDSVLSNPGYNLLLISSTLDKENNSPALMQKINRLAANCAKHHINFICLTASGDDAIAQVKEQFHTNYPFYSTDETVLRTMIRSNPGLMMLKSGIVIAKWHYHALPTYQSLNEQYFHK